LPGTKIVETWDHVGLRASGSHDVIFDDVVFPLDHEIDVRAPEAWKAPDITQATIHAVFIAAIYDGVARAARDWLVAFLQDRVPANLGAPLATMPRIQEIAGAIEARLAVNARLIDSFARDFDEGLTLSGGGHCATDAVAEPPHRAKHLSYHGKDKQRFVVSVVAYDSPPWAP
jgi:alkylation response protein AidB-like acyl-CoA dehydrogenase